MKDVNGKPRPYDARHHDAFQILLRAFGDAGHVALKARMRDAIVAGHAPEAFALPDERLARAAMRIGLRQMLAARGPSPALAAWQQAHEPAHRDAEDSDEINH